MRVIPIAATKVDWKSFIGTIQEGTGHSPTRVLDQANKSLNDLLSFPLVINCDERVSYESLQTDTRLSHVFISFLVESPTRISGISRFGSLHIYPIDSQLHAENVYMVMSGTLLQWREVVYNVLKQEQINPQINKLFQQIKEVFTRSPQIWSGDWRL